MPHRDLFHSTPAVSTALTLALLLAGCQIVPPSGSTTTAQVLSLPGQRSNLGGGYRDLHAAVRASVARAEVAAGRLVLGECFEPDPEAGGGRVWFTVTTLLPAGLAVPERAQLDVLTAEGVTPDAVGARPLRQHGRHLALVAAGPAAEPPRCRPPGAGPGVMRVAIRTRVQAWQHDFAAAEVARHDQFGDAELAARSVVELGCRVEALGDRSFMQMRWFARMPPGLRLSTGDVVTLRAGAAEDSKDVAPLAQVLDVVTRPAGSDPRERVACR